MPTAWCWYLVKYLNRVAANHPKQHYLGQVLLRSIVIPVYNGKSTPSDGIYDNNFLQNLANAHHNCLKPKGKKVLFLKNLTFP